MPLIAAMSSQQSNAIRPSAPARRRFKTAARQIPRAHRPNLQDAKPPASHRPQAPLRCATEVLHTEAIQDAYRRNCRHLAFGRDILAPRRHRRKFMTRAAEADDATPIMPHHAASSLAAYGTIFHHRHREMLKWQRQLDRCHARQYAIISGASAKWPAI